MKKVLQKLLLILLCFVSVQAFAQERTVTGQTTDKDGLPLPGVSVYVKASTLGTVTDLDGAFSLSVPDNENSILVFSSLGFQPQEIRLGNQTTFKSL